MNKVLLTKEHTHCVRFGRLKSVLTSSTWDFIQTPLYYSCNRVHVVRSVLDQEIIRVQ